MTIEPHLGITLEELRKKLFIGKGYSLKPKQQISEYMKKSITPAPNVHMYNRYQQQQHVYTRSVLHLNLTTDHGTIGPEIVVAEDVELLGMLVELDVRKLTGRDVAEYNLPHPVGKFLFGSTVGWLELAELSLTQVT